MSKKSVTALVTIMLSLIVPGGAALSAIHTFALNDVVFDDGAEASGFFQFTGIWDIKVSGGNASLFSALEYTPSNSAVLPVEDVVGLTMFLGATTTHRSLRLHFPKPSNGWVTPGMVLPLITTDSGQWNGSKEMGDGTVRYITGGELIVPCDAQCVPLPGIPEPSAYAFVAMGLIALSGLLFIGKLGRAPTCPVPLGPRRQPDQNRHHAA